MSQDDFQNDLLAFEKQRLETAAKLSAWSDDKLGSDPIAVLALAGPRFLVLHRWPGKVSLLNDELATLAELPVARGARSWALVKETHLWIAGTQSDSLDHIEIQNEGLRRLAPVKLSGVAGVRDLCFIDDQLYVLDDFECRLVRVDLSAAGSAGSTPQSAQHQSWPLPAGPKQILSLQNLMIINCLLAHQILVIPVNRAGPNFEAMIHLDNDGPFWGIAATRLQNRIIIAAGGIENHPLERTDGGFGFVDSFLYIFALDQVGKEGWSWAGRNASSYLETNLSTLGVVTPKALRISNTGILEVAGYGCDQLARFRYSSREQNLVLTALGQQTTMPGVSSFQTFGRGLRVAVSPLADEIRTWNGAGKLQAQRRFDPPRDWRSLLGELLLFTTRLAPQNDNEGGRSRFTCEACHFEGEGDGRVHYTGRDGVYATPKPLRGLGRVSPLFSSAGDDSMAKMVNAEFRVANQGNPVFSLDATGDAYLSGRKEFPDQVDPLGMREALLSFLFDFEHEPNRAFVTDKSLNAAAIQGIDVFRKHCQDCHQPVTSMREPKRIVAAADWASTLADEGVGLVWGAGFYSKVGITPYFDPSGTRVASLRRVWQKFPYFSDGSAHSLNQVLDDFRFDDHKSWHRTADAEPVPGHPSLRRLSTTEKEGLLAVLRYF